VPRHPVGRLKLFYFLLYVPVGLQAPYLFLFLTRQGFSDTELGTLAAITPLVNLAAPPIWGAVADSFGDRRRTLALLLLASGLVFPLLALAPSYPMALAAMALFSLFAGTPGPVTDAIVLEHITRTGGDYGRIRLWGSAGFAAPLLVLGRLLPRGTEGTAADLYPIFIGFVAFRLISVFCIRLLPSSTGRVGRGTSWSAVRIFGSRRFLALALCGAVGWAAMSGYYVYFSIYLDRMHIADNLKGYFWVTAVVAEISMMWVIGGLIRRIGAKWTLVLSLLGVTVRLTAFSFPLSPMAIAAVQLLHALTFTAFSVAAITFIGRAVPSHLRASGQTAWAAITSGLGSGVGSKLAGVTVGALTITGMYRVFGLAAAVAMVAAVVFVREPEGEGKR
jgi:MFS transporter, PPP family, 3-phenylpropionic acid transporter